MDPKSDIIFFSLSRYDDPISFVGLSLAKELAKHNRVFFIEQPYTWKDYWKGRNDAAMVKRKMAWGSGSGATYLKDEKIPDNLHYVVPPRMFPANFLPAGPLYNAVSSWNNKILSSQLREIIREHAISNFVFVNCFNPFYFGSFPPDIKPFVNAYYCVDDISQVAYTRKHGLALEEKMVHDYDICFATGMELQRIKKAHNRHTFYLPNAGDYELFSQAVHTALPKPAELLPYAGKKIIGFTGSVEYRTDFGLLKKMVEYHHDKIFVLVGPVYAPEIHDMGFDKMQNVVLVGAKHITVLPAYLQHMDVMIIPYQLSTLTKSIYPLKINEYLGAGKPVVTTAFSDDIQTFGDVIYVAKNKEDFLVLIDRAIQENGQSLIHRRMERARENTWAARVSQFWSFVDEAGF